jgi:ATP-dependent DNA helicase PIF1
VAVLKLLQFILRSVRTRIAGRSQRESSLDIGSGSNKEPIPVPDINEASSSHKTGQEPRNGTSAPLQLKSDFQNLQHADATIRFSDESESYLDVLLKGEENIFLTGKAGTGKTTLVKHFIGSCKKNIVVLAPTGVAAMQVGGQTIHSFFGFRPGLLLPEFAPGKPGGDVHTDTQVLVVDEISMCRADSFDAMDRYLRIWGPVKGEPFGGIQIVCIGDLFQLPPVLINEEREHHSRVYPSKYFFDAKAFKKASFRCLELTKVYRQSDEMFLSILNQIRTGSVNDRALNALNARVRKRTPSEEDSYITLSTHNKIVDGINTRKLAQLPGNEFIYQAVIQGMISDADLRVERTLRLREGAKVMFVRNDQGKRWVNGTIGKVKSLSDESIEVEVPDDMGTPERFLVGRETFEKIAYVSKHGILKKEIVGTFVQFPLRLAWAITIHKSQGQTFKQVHLNLGTAFETGQIYVALSRCTSLEGITMERPLSGYDILVDPLILAFHKRLNQQRATAVR